MASTTINPATRPYVVGAVLMLTGLSLVPTLTSVAVLALISKRSREEMQQLEDELVKSTAALRRIAERLARMEGWSAPSDEPV